MKLALLTAICCSTFIVLTVMCDAVEPAPNKGHLETNINYAVLSFVERLSSSLRFEMY